MKDANAKQYSGSINSPLGKITVLATEDTITHVSFSDKADFPATNDVVDKCLLELREYFEQGRTAFTIPLAPVGTDFERGVWDALLGVAYAETCSYLDIARRVKNEKAIRAVGRANGANPIAIIIPCHRVIGSDGSLTGYGGGIDRKRWLLDHEARVAGTRLL